MSQFLVKNLTTVQDTAAVVNTTAGVFSFTTSGQPVAANRVVVTNPDASIAMFVKLNGTASATAYDHKVLAGTEKEIDMVMAKTVSIWLPASFAGVTLGTHFQIAGMAK